MNFELRKPKKKDTRCRLCESKAEYYLVIDGVRGLPLGLAFCGKHWNELKKMIGR